MVRDADRALDGVALAAGQFRRLIESLYRECLDKGAELAQAAEQEKAAAS